MREQIQILELEEQAVLAVLVVSEEQAVLDLRIFLNLSLVVAVDVKQILKHQDKGQIYNIQSTLNSKKLFSVWKKTLNTTVKKRVIRVTEMGQNLARNQKFVINVMVLVQLTLNTKHHLDV